MQTMRTRGTQRVALLCCDSLKGIRFGAISAVGRVDKFSPEQIVKIAREAQAHARKTLAEVKKIW